MISLPNKIRCQKANHECSYGCSPAYCSSSHFRKTLASFVLELFELFCRILFFCKHSLFRHRILMFNRARNWIPRASWSRPMKSHFQLGVFWSCLVQLWWKACCFRWPHVGIGYEDGSIMIHENMRSRCLAQFETLQNQEALFSLCLCLFMAIACTVLIALPGGEWPLWNICSWPNANILVEQSSLNSGFFVY